MTQSYTILGGHGFIGQHLAAACQSSGRPVYCPERSELSKLDGKNLGHVFYCLGTDNWDKEPFGAVDAHVHYLRLILERSQFDSLTYLSSTRLYFGAEAAREDARLVIDYQDAGRLYNATKIAGETLCLATKRAAVRVVRLSNVVGFAPRGIALIPGLIRAALSTGEMNLWIAPESAKDYIAIEDVVDILPRICERGQDRLYNVAGGANITVASIVARIAALTGARAKWQKGETIVFPLISIDRVRQEFQFEPRPALDLLPEICGRFKAALSETTAPT